MTNRPSIHLPIPRTPTPRPRSSSWRRALSPVVVATLLASATLPAHAAIIPVTSLADNGPGSLRDAIATAAAGDTVDATAIAGTIVLESELNVDKSLTLNGPGQDELILSGNQATRVLHLSSATSTVNISGLTVADGYQSSPPGPDDKFGASGGIFSRAALTLSDCTIRGNSIFSEAGWSGGGVTSLGPLTVTHCLIAQNSGDAGRYGGGIVILGSGAITVVDSTIVHNATTGISISSFGVALISRCTISGNTVNGVFTGYSEWTIDQCTVSGNGYFGLQAEGFGKILNSTIVGHPIGISKNPSTGGGVIGNTIFDNERDINQTVYPAINDKAPISLGHNITRGNAGGDAATGPGGWLNQPTDRRNTDPLLGPLQNNGGPTPTHALLPGSPAINAGGGLDEMQQISVRGSAGTFTLTFNGETTAALPFNATAAQVQDALNALASIGGVGGSVAVIRNPDRGNDFFVSFSGGTLAAQDQPLMTSSGSGGATASVFTTSNGGPLPAVDQRGLPRVAFGRVDVGAFEVQPCETPTVTLTGPASGSVFAVGTPVTFTATFTGENSPHTAVWTIDGTTTVPGVVDEVAKTVTATVTFTGAGVYAVQLTLSNDCGNSATSGTIGDLPAQVVIYDPSAGFVTGGGWINSPAGAANWVGGENLTGKASFGFISRYRKGQTVPSGETEFQFKAGALNFKSTSYQWLVVSGARAQYKGVGTINGVAGYGFLLTAIDGQVNGGGGADRFRIKIWDANGAVYDNQMGADDSATPTTTLGGGSIVIHSK